MKPGSSKLPKGGIITKPGSSMDSHTGSWRYRKPLWDKKKCINCLICWSVCPDVAIHARGGKIKKFDYDYCKGCGICAKQCPVKCITMVPEGDKR